jgi:DNA topoisomerase-1
MTYLFKFFQYLIDPKYTSEMEGKLDEVKDGETTRLELLQDFYDHFKAQYDQAGDLPKDDPSLLFYGQCPKPGCDGIIVPRRSRFGVFLGCSKYPTCDFVTNQVPLPWIKVAPNETEDQDHPEEGSGKTKVFSGGKRAEPEQVGKDCPLCGKPLVKRFTKRGNRPFIGCSGYPKCKHLENIPKADKAPDESEPT